MPSVPTTATFGLVGRGHRLVDAEGHAVVIRIDADQVGVRRRMLLVTFIAFRRPSRRLARDELKLGYS